MGHVLAGVRPVDDRVGVRARRPHPRALARAGSRTRQRAGPQCSWRRLPGRTPRDDIQPSPKGHLMAATAETHPFDLATREGRAPYKVADLSQAEFGRKEIRLAEQEMPGLMALRARNADSPARRRAHHGQPAHDDPDRRADRDADLLGADVRWVSCNIFSTQDHAAAAVVVGRPEPGARPRPRAARPSSRGRARRSTSTGGARRRRSSGPTDRARR